MTNKCQIPKLSVYGVPGPDTIGRMIGFENGAFTETIFGPYDFDPDLGRL